MKISIPHSFRVGIDVAVTEPAVMANTLYVEVTVTLLNVLDIVRLVKGVLGSICVNEEGGSDPRYVGLQCGCPRLVVIIESVDIDNLRRNGTGVISHVIFN